jgi:hypothetical protein
MESIMMKSLVAGAAALALMGAAALAQNVNSYSRSVTQTTPAGAISSETTVQKSTDPLTGTTTERTETYRGPSGSSAATTTTRTVDPDVFNPTSRVRTYHEERTLSPGPATVEKRVTTETTAPTGQTTTTYRSSTTTKSGD